MVRPRVRSTRDDERGNSRRRSGATLGGRDKSAAADRRPHDSRAPDRRPWTRVVDRILLVGYRSADSVADSLTVRHPDRMAGRGPLGGLDAALDAAGDGRRAAAGLRHAERDARRCWRTCVSRRRRCRCCRAADRTRLSSVVCGVRAVVSDDGRSGVSKRGRCGCWTCSQRASGCAPSWSSELGRFGEADRLLANVNTQADLDALESLQNH